MNTTRDDMHELFSMFHDFTLLDMKYEGSTLSLTIDVPWNELWDEEETFYIQLIVHGCDYISCTYRERIQNVPFENYAEIKFDKNEKTTTDIQTIASLRLSIQSYEFKEPNHYIFYCNGEEKVEEGQFMFTASGYTLLDKNGSNLSLEKMKQLATMWWESIDKMWGEQKSGE